MESVQLLLNRKGVIYLIIYLIYLILKNITISAGGWKRPLTAAAAAESADLQWICCPPHPSSPAAQPAAAARRVGALRPLRLPLHAELPWQHESTGCPWDHRATTFSPRGTSTHRSKRPTSKTHPPESAKPIDSGWPTKLQTDANSQMIQGTVLPHTQPVPQPPPKKPGWFLFISKLNNFKTTLACLKLI